MTDALDKRNALAAKLFPLEWAKIVNQPGANKKRQQLRQRAERKEIYIRLKNEGHTCGDCTYLSTNKAMIKGTICLLKSDYSATVRVSRIDLCNSWASVHKEKSK